MRNTEARYCTLPNPTSQSMTCSWVMISPLTFQKQQMLPAVASTHLQRRPRSSATLYNPARATASAIVKDDSRARVGNLERREFTPNRTKLPPRTVSANCCYRVVGRRSSDSISVTFLRLHNNALWRMSTEVVWLWRYVDLVRLAGEWRWSWLQRQVTGRFLFFDVLFDHIKVLLTWEDKTLFNPVYAMLFLSENYFGGLSAQNMDCR